MKSFNLSLLLYFLCPIIAFSQSDAYSYKRKLAKSEKENFYSVSLTPDIIAHCKSEQNDIRIYNFSLNDTIEIPYLLEWLGTKNEEKIIPFERINTVYSEKCCSYLTLKINRQQTLNRIKLEIADGNFDKWVKVEGSSDNKNWFTIAERLRIVRFQNGSEHFEYTTLDFPKSEYAYYRLQFDDNNVRRIEVSNAYAFEITETEGNYSELKIKDLKRIENKKAATSELIIELPANYKVNHISVKSNTNKDFYRNMNVYGYLGTIHTPKGDKENWYLLNTSIFSSVGNNSVTCYNEQVQKLKIEIVNYNDSPVESLEIKAFAEQCRLVAELPASDNLHLVYGRKNDQAPTYDLVHFKGKIPVSIPEITYSEEQVVLLAGKANNAFPENKNWLWVAMGAVILLIGFFSVKMLKKEQE